MADFTGFYLGGIHSSTYGILRTSDGDRYHEGLIPEFDDFSIELSGGDGSLYGGRKFKKTPFEIKIAFDHLTEAQLRELRQWLGKKELQSFRFDERPYKTYWVKISTKPELEYVCFMEEKEDRLLGEKERIYKGEGKLSFMAYSPFGYCIDESTIMTHEGLRIENKINWQELKNYSLLTVKDDNMIEWASAAGLKYSLENYNVFSAGQNPDTVEYSANLYNPGDFDTDFELYLDLSKTSSTLEEKTITLMITDEQQEEQSFCFSVGDLDSNSKIILNSKKHSLEVYSEDGKIKNLRYDLVKSSHWISIPQGESIMKIECDLSGLEPQIKYNYKYY